MRILNAYITRDFLVTFAITLLVFLFVMAIGNIFRVVDLFSRGVSGWLILQVFSYGIPFSLIFAIPMSVLAAVLLQFSRMASDREIIAMKACGISVWQVLQPPLIISSLLCLGCIYINCTLAPNSHFARRKVLGKLGVETPLKLLDEGRFIREFPGLHIYIARKSGDVVHDIVIYQFGDKGLKQTVRAKTGTIRAAARDRNKIMINLTQVRIDQVDEQFPDDLTKTRHMTAGEYPLTIDVTELLNKEIVWKKRADLTMAELIRAVRGLAYFSAADFSNLDSLAEKLGSADDPLSEYILSAVSADTRHLLEIYDGSEAVRHSLVLALADDFNRLLNNPRLFAPERFARVNMTEITAKLLKEKPAGAELLRLNRMLLEDAYPHEIVRNYLSSLKPEDQVVYRMSLLVEASTRLALSFACYAFVILGVALGIKIHRRESTIGIAVALLLVFFFYFFIIIADSLVAYPQFQPHLIVWIPFIISEVLGFYLIQRAA